LRESPALHVAVRLAERYGHRIKIVEPNIEELPKDLSEAGAELIDLETALTQCGLLVLLVDHDEFKLVSVQERNSAFVYDTRGIWAPSIATAA
jgi:UDP-N-acetyl-D-mannosaminuronic acid dehydrogenase